MSKISYFHLTNFSPKNRLDVAQTVQYFQYFFTYIHIFPPIKYPQLNSTQRTCQTLITETRYSQINLRRLTILDSPPRFPSPI